MTLYTIGFTQTTAERFFRRLRDAGAARVLDVRVHRDGQLAGFAKARDLEYFLRELAGAEYRVVSELAPTAELVARYRDRELSWDAYAAAYNALIAERRPESSIDAKLLDRGCLLCSEPKAIHCHRMLATAYLAERFGDLEIVHL